ncbi:MAG: HAMP domain-containing sensor histidine kinase [Planctomycetota bacterium]|jgi:signal transduction histidine kinase
MMLGRWSLEKLVVWIGTVATLSFCLPTGIYLMRNTYSLGEHSVLQSADTLARTLGAQLIDAMLVRNQLALHETIGRAAAANDDTIYICVVDATGEVLAHTFEGEIPSDIPALWRADPDGPVRFRTQEGPCYDVAAPIKEGQLGTIHVGISGRHAVEVMRGVMWPMGVMVATALAVTLIGSRLVAVMVSRPIRQLENRMFRFPEQAEEWEPPGLPVTWEVLSLASGFSRMAERLEDLERERELAMHRMIQTERMVALGELAAGLAHEVNNPLDGMAECVRYMEAKPEDADRRARYLPMLRDGLQRIASVVRNVLAFARSGQEVALEEVSAADVVDSVLLMLQGRLKSAGVCLSWKRPGPCHCVCNRQGLSQAVLNLVLNAIQAAVGSDDPRVSISIARDAKCVRVAVEDSGPGVPGDIREKVFEPFFTMMPAGEGTGLGLAISRQLVRAAGGDLVLSMAPAKLGGACFVIRLPVPTQRERLQ